VVLVNLLHRGGHAAVFLPFQQYTLGKGGLIVIANWFGEAHLVDFVAPRAGRGKAVVPLAVIGD
jgi:hypothetical protein